MGWLFLLLAFLFTGIALTPSWRENWGWGRTGQGGPLSPVGWSAWILMFLLISGTGFGIVPGKAILVGFVCVMAAGIWDSYQNSKMK